MSRVYLAKKNDAPVHDDSASHVIAIIENSYFDAMQQANELKASIVAAHDLGDAGYEIHLGPDAAVRFSAVPTEYQKTKAIMAAILFAGGTSQYKTPETAVKAAGEFLAEAINSPLKPVAG
jgi:hypothetical protein